MPFAQEIVPKTLHAQYHTYCPYMIHLSSTSTNQYMGFGLSGSTSSTLMFEADPTIAWVDETDGPQAVDYYLSAYTQVGLVMFDYLQRLD